MGHLTAVFAYGTLKRGGVRERYWPRKPLSVAEATVRGALYDVGPYPAMIEGSDLVAGEVWQFAMDEMRPTITALDEVEGFSGAADDLFQRAIVACQTAQGDIPAWTYLYARIQEMNEANRIRPDAGGVCRWPA